MRHFRSAAFRLGARLLAAAVFVSVLFVAILLAANRVDTSITDADLPVIQDLELDEACRNLNGFPAQFQCIHTAQSTVNRRYSHTKDAFDKGVSGHEISDYAERGYGSCYDRSLLFEKTFAYYGLKARRVAIFNRQSAPWGYLKAGIPSHALLEVKTDRGWMVVDSITPLLGVDGAGQVYSIRDLRRGLRSEEIDAETFGVPISVDFFDGDFVYVYGLYSRHGYFFEPHLPAPEVSWKDFRLW